MVIDREKYAKLLSETFENKIFSDIKDYTYKTQCKNCGAREFKNLQCTYCKTFK